MKWVGLMVLVLSAVWIQTSFLPLALAVVPNVLLIVIIYASTTRPASEAIVMAIVGGLLLDLASGTDFGLRMAFYSLVVLLVAGLKQSGADFDNMGLVMGTVTGGAILYNASVVSGLVLVHISLPVAVVLRRVGLELLFNLILVITMGPFLAKRLRSASILPSIGGRAS